MTRPQLARVIWRRLEQPCVGYEAGQGKEPAISRNSFDYRAAPGTAAVLYFHTALEELGLSRVVDHAGQLTRCKPSSLSLAAARSQRYCTHHLPARAQTLPSPAHRLSASSVLPFIRAITVSDLPLTVETCFHYVHLAPTAQHIRVGRSEFICCPPIRGSANCEELWVALLDGAIGCSVSDHSPSAAELKTVVSWMCVKAAKQAGLGGQESPLNVVYDADSVI